MIDPPPPNDLEMERLERYTGHVERFVEARYSNCDTSDTTCVIGLCRY